MSLVEVVQSLLHFDSGKHNLDRICSIAVWHTSGAHVSISYSLYLFDVILRNNVVERHKQLVKVLYKFLGIGCCCNLCKALNIGEQYCNHFVLLRLCISCALQFIHCILRQKFLNKVLGLFLLHHKFVCSHLDKFFEAIFFLRMHNVSPCQNQYKYHDKTQHIQDISQSRAIIWRRHLEAEFGDITHIPVTVARTHHELVRPFRQAYVFLVRIGCPVGPVVVEAFESILVIGITECVVRQSSHFEPDITVLITYFVNNIPTF